MRSLLIISVLLHSAAISAFAEGSLIELRHSAPKAQVFFFGGLNETSQTYENEMSALHRYGYSSAFFKSQLQDDSFSGDFSEVLDHARTAVQYARFSTNAPTIVIGHSMGFVIAESLVREDAFDSLIRSSYTNPLLSFGEVLTEDEEAKVRTQDPDLPVDLKLKFGATSKPVVVRVQVRSAFVQGLSEGLDRLFTNYGLWTRRQMQIFLGEGDQIIARQAIEKYRDLVYSFGTTADSIAIHSMDPKDPHNPWKASLGDRSLGLLSQIVGEKIESGPAIDKCKATISHISDWFQSAPSLSLETP